MTALKLAKDLSLPLELVTESVGILAVKRAGKSHTAKRLAEQLHKRNQQIVVVDPKGDWWGLRSSADGKGPGLPLPILGGEHGDIPLEPGGGELVAKLVVEQAVSLVLDLSDFRKYQVAQFMTDFLETLYRLKAKDQYRTPMMLIIDEADAIAPQRPGDREERMLGAAEDIVRRGGQRGIGIVMVSQRAAVLNKNVLTQVGVLILLRTTGKQDIDAVREWIKHHGQPHEAEQVLATIAAMPRGDAWVWAPGWPTPKGIFERVTVLPIDTFDSGATPKPGQKQVKPKMLADVDLVAFQREMAATLQKAEAEDPKKLRTKIADLERELRKANTFMDTQRPARAAKPAEVKKVEIKKVEVPALTDGQINRLEKLIGQLGEVAGKIDSGLGGFVSTLRQMVETVKFAREVKWEAPPTTSNALRVPPKTFGGRDLPPARLVPTKQKSEANGRAASDGQLDGPERRIVDAIAWLNYMGVESPRKQAVALVAGYAVGGAFLNPLARLRTRGIVNRGEPIRLTNDGQRLATVEKSLTTADLREQTLQRLDGPGRKILEILFSTYPAVVTKDWLAERAGYAMGGAFLNPLSRLRTMGLVEYPEPKGVKAADILFQPG